MDGVRGRARGAAHQRAARRARGTALPADGRDHGAGAQRARQDTGIEVPALGADERRPRAAHRAVRV